MCTPSQYQLEYESILGDKFSSMPVFGVFTQPVDKAAFRMGMFNQQVHHKAGVDLARKRIKVDL